MLAYDAEASITTSCSSSCVLVCTVSPTKYTYMCVYVSDLQEEGIQNVQLHLKSQTVTMRKTGRLFSLFWFWRAKAAWSGELRQLPRNTDLVGLP